MEGSKIYEFAMKWLGKYEDMGIDEDELLDCFADECFGLGFKMDCGDSLEAAYPGMNVLNDYKEFVGISDQINDMSLLSSAIFSKWRGVTHWSYNESLISDENRAWFIAAFSRLSQLME